MLHLVYSSAGTSAECSRFLTPATHFSASLVLVLVLSEPHLFGFGCSQVWAPTSLKAFQTSKPTPRPMVNITVNMTRGQSGVRCLRDIGRKPMVSSVKGVRAGTLLSPDVHIKENRLAEKKIRDQASQTAGNAKKSHIFQSGGVEDFVAALETKLALGTQNMIHSRISNSFLSLHPLVNGIAQDTIHNTKGS